ncbi:hypothetical protein quinque_000789 [Culex quinquefasciatus]
MRCKGTESAKCKGLWGWWRLAEMRGETKGKGMQGVRRDAKVRKRCKRCKDARSAQKCRDAQRGMARVAEGRDARGTGGGDAQEMPEIKGSAGVQGVECSRSASAEMVQRCTEDAEAERCEKSQGGVSQRCKGCRSRSKMQECKEHGAEDPSARWG